MSSDAISKLSFCFKNADAKFKLVVSRDDEDGWQSLKEKIDSLVGVDFGGEELMIMVDTERIGVVD